MMFIVMTLVVASMETDFRHLTQTHFPATPATPQNVLQLYVPTATTCTPNEDLAFNAIVRTCIEPHFSIPEADVCSDRWFIGPAAEHHVGPLQVEDGHWDIPGALMGQTTGDTLHDVTVRLVSPSNRLCPCGPMHSCYTSDSLPPICVPDAYSVPTTDGVEGIVLALFSGAGLVAMVGSGYVGSR